MAGSAFDKDFGYLMPFLKKVAEAADTIQDAAAREELKRLVAGEQSKWQRIQQLLGGAAAAAPPQASPAPAAVAQPASAAPAPDGPRPVTERQFTVGSLRPR
ncbi:MAG TPA: hypothetical protein VKA70_12580 [Blastocatellia bacterium]|nr:hypothetical protein [Blastocatellia bacterium]